MKTPIYRITVAINALTDTCVPNVNQIVVLVDNIARTEDSNSIKMQDYIPSQVVEK